MIRPVLLCLAALWPLSVRADPAPLAAGQVLRGHFVQDRYLAGFAKPVRSEGHFVLAQGHGLIWQGEKPFSVVTVITPAGMAQSMGGKPTMKLSAAQAPFLAQLYDVMAGAMAGDWQAVQGAFDVRRDGARVTLLPRQSVGTAQPVRSISARLGAFVEEVEVTKEGGDRDHLRFDSQEVTTGPLSADETAAFGRLQ